MTCFVLPACPVPISAWGRPVCIITTANESEPGLNYVSAAEVLTTTDYIEGLTFIALGGILMYCIAYAVVRGLTLHLARHESRLLFERIANALYHNNPAQALMLLRTAPDSPLARVIQATLGGGVSYSESAEGGAKWARNLAMYIETREAQSGLWELNLGIYLSSVIGLCFGYYIINPEAWIRSPNLAGLSQALEVFGFSMFITTVAVCQHKWLLSIAEDLCLSVDRFSIAITERLLNCAEGSVTRQLSYVPNGETTKLIGAFRTRPLADRSPLILLNLRD